MQKESKYNIYTDASFDDNLKFGTYAIIIMHENKVVKTISKRCNIDLKNSTECEVFAIYQAINIILTCFFNKNKFQKFCINTDCSVAREFFVQKNKNINIFKENLELIKIIKNIYENISKKLTKENCSFNIKWIPRKNNKIAHKYAYSIFKELRTNNYKNELLLIDKNVFIDILLKLNKIQYEIIIYLIKSSNEQKLVNLTQKEVAEDLNMSICAINKNFKVFINLSILEKIKNGRYALLI